MGKDVVTTEEKEMMLKFAKRIAPRNWVIKLENGDNSYPESDNPNAVLVSLDIRGKLDETDHDYNGITRTVEYFDRQPHFEIVINAALWNKWKTTMIHQIAAGKAFVIAGRELKIGKGSTRVHAWEYTYAVKCYPEYLKMVQGKGKRFREIKKELTEKAKQIKLKAA